MRFESLIGSMGGISAGSGGLSKKKPLGKPSGDKLIRRRNRISG